MKHPLLRKVIIYSLLTIFYLGITEIVLRLFDPEAVLVKTFDERLLFSLYPNKSGTVLSEEYKVSVNTNEQSGRQSLYPTAKYPILLLGDSFAEGWGVAEDQIFTSIANKNLPKDRQILNMGVHGSCPALFQIHTKEMVAKFQPKEVWIQIFDNDLDDNDKLEVFMENYDGNLSPKKPMLAKFIGVWGYNFVKESTIFRLAKRAYKKAKSIPDPILYYKSGREPELKILTHEESLKKFGRLSPLGDQIGNKYNGQFEFYALPDKEVWKGRLAKQELYLQKIYEYLKEKDIKLNLIYIPAKEFFAEKGITGNLSTKNLNLFHAENPHYRLLKSFCETRNVNCLFASEIFWNQKPEDLYFPYDAHWNAKGHEIFGNYFSNYLLK